LSQQISSGDKKQQELIELLKEAQKKSGYVSGTAMVDLAELLDMPVNDVYAVASFYSYLSIKPLGRNVIRICKSLPCYLKGSQMIIDSISVELGIKPGETTPDGRFSFLLVNCVGLCDMAPAMMINDDAYGDLTPEKITQILKNYD